MSLPSQPDPKPEPKAQPSPAPCAKPQPSPAPADAGRRGGEAYTTMPSFEAPKRRWGPLLLAALLAAGAGGFGVLRHRASAPAVAPVAQTRQTLPYSQKDLDRETTLWARTLLAKDAQARQFATLDQNKPSDPLPSAQAAHELAAAPQVLRDDIASGKAGFYTFQLAELADEGGDVYDIAVDGLPILRITTSPQLKSITLPIDATKPHSVTQTLVFARPRAVYAKNGTGAPPPTQAVSKLSIRTSEGEAASHVSAPGQSETWTTQFHGSMGSGGGR